MADDTPRGEDTPLPEDTPRDAADAREARRDAPIDPLCSGVGLVGGPCRQPGDTCASGLECRQPVDDGAGTTLRSVRRVLQGEPDPAHPGFFRPAERQRPELDIPFSVFTNTLCTSPCDVSLEARETSATGDLDTCGPCAACTTQMGLHGLVDSQAFFVRGTQPFGDDTGFCRLSCAFDPRTNGGCPAGSTCDPRSLVCVEACTRDTECQFSFEEMRSGDRVTIAHSEWGTCDLGTGRCTTGEGTSAVGRACESAADCSVDVGVCVDEGRYFLRRRGTCAEANCQFADDTDPDGACDGGRGVCVSVPPDEASLCLAGCIGSSDCNPGNACRPLPVSSPVGPRGFRGVCTPACDLTVDVPGDALFSCREDERCDVARSREPDREGVCRPTCTVDGDCPRPDELCELAPGAAYGFCRVLDQTCEREGEGCFLGQRCDLIADPTVIGRCVPSCTEVGCPAGLECIPSRGVCRRSCGGGCPDTQACVAGICEAP